MFIFVKSVSGRSLLLLLVLLFIAGCSVNSSVEQNKTDASETRDLSHAADTENRGSKRIMADATMDVELPAEPKNVAVLLDYYSDHLLALGVKPRASTTSLVNNQFLPYLGDQMKGVIPLGTSESPNLEALLDAKPDLIIAYAPSHKEIESSLRKIAPTMLLDGDLMNDWRKLFLELGKIVGKEQLAKQKLGGYLLKAEAANKELKRRVGEDVFVVMRVMPKELRIYGTDDIRIGRIIHQELGLNGLKLKENKAMMPISLEELPTLNADHIFLMENVEDVAVDKLEEMKSSALWKNTKAVQENQVYIVQQQLWNRGIAPIGSDQIIDQVLQVVK